MSRETGTPTGKRQCGLPQHPAGVLAEEVMLSYLLPRCDRDAPYTVHVGRVAIGVLGGGEVACTVLQGLSTGCQGKEMIRLLAAAAQSPQPSGFSS